MGSESADQELLRPDQEYRRRWALAIEGDEVKVVGNSRCLALERPVPLRRPSCVSVSSLPIAVFAEISRVARSQRPVLPPVWLLGCATGNMTT